MKFQVSVELVLDGKQVMLEATAKNKAEAKELAEAINSGTVASGNYVTVSTDTAALVSRVDSHLTG